MMTENFLLSLQITALGMGLVFGAIILLWLMMALLTHFTADKEPASDSLEPDSISQADSKLKVAALAVAIALAEQGQSAAHPLAESPTAVVSAWQLGMRTSQRTQKGNFRSR